MFVNIDQHVILRRSHTNFIVLFLFSSLSSQDDEKFVCKIIYFNF